VTVGLRLGVKEESGRRSGIVGEREERTLGKEYGENVRSNEGVMYDRGAMVYKGKGEEGGNVRWSSWTYEDKGQNGEGKCKGMGLFYKASVWVFLYRHFSG